MNSLLPTRYAGRQPATLHVREPKWRIQDSTRHKAATAQRRPLLHHAATVDMMFPETWAQMRLGEASAIPPRPRSMWPRVFFQRAFFRARMGCSRVSHPRHRWCFAGKAAACHYRPITFEPWRIQCRKPGGT